MPSSYIHVSEYCYSKEMRYAMQRHEQGDAHVIPVLMRPTFWKGTPFEKLQMLPNNVKAVTLWSNQDEAFYDVTERISIVVNELTAKLDLSEARALYNDQRYEGALVIYEQLIKRELNLAMLAMAYLEKGKALFALQRYEESLVAYEKAPKVDAKIADDRFYREKARMLYQLQRYEESLAGYEEAIHCDPLFAEGYVEKAKVLLQLQRDQEALAMYEQAIRLDPVEANYYIQVGDLLLKMERFEESLDRYGYAIELKPEEIEYYDKKGEVLLNLKRFEEALAIYDKLLDIISKQPEFIESFVSYYDKKGQALLKLNRYREALATYEQCIQDYGANNPYFHYRKGKAFFGLERYEESLVAYEEAIRLSGSDCDPEFYQAKGMVYERLAMQAYEMAEQRRDHWQPEKMKLEEITIKSGDLDTVVVPAREETFQKTFLKENHWFAIKIHNNMQPKIKFIAVYQAAPQSAITYIAPVSSIEPWEGTNKFVVNFAEPARKIGPIPLLKNGKIKAPQNLRYANYERLLHAQTLDDVWDQNGVNTP